MFCSLSLGLSHLIRFTSCCALLNVRLRSISKPEKSRIPTTHPELSAYEPTVVLFSITSQSRLRLEWLRRRDSPVRLGERLRHAVHPCNHPVHRPRHVTGLDRRRRHPRILHSVLNFKHQEFRFRY